MDRCRYFDNKFDMPSRIVDSEENRYGMWKVIFSIGNLSIEKFKNHGVGTVFSGDLLFIGYDKMEIGEFRESSYLSRRILSTTLSLVFVSSIRGEAIDKCTWINYAVVFNLISYKIYLILIYYQTRFIIKLSQFSN